VYTYPLSDAFSLYGKLGYAHAKSTASCFLIATGLPCGPAGVVGATRNAATYGLGGVYNVTPAIGIRLGWDRYGVATSTAGVTSNGNSNVYSLAGVFKF
jgi:opacity protein-like surface antigen